MIVNVSSIATRGLNRVPYAAAKGGVNAITASLAWDVAERGIRVVATAPGGTEAPPRIVPRNPNAEQEQRQDWYQTIVDQTIQSSLMKRYGTLDELVGPILFFASEDASYITGVTVTMGGGDLGYAPEDVPIFKWRKTHETYNICSPVAGNGCCSARSR